jgi:hypothetical protein
MAGRRSLNVTLWVAALFNLGAALLLAFPAALGQRIGLPADVPVVYSALTGLFVLLFGASYAWMALQPAVVRPLLAFGAIGKTAAFVAAVLLWCLDAIPLPILLAGIGDLVFAALFVRWLWDSR